MAGCRSPRSLGPSDLVLSHFSLAPDHPIEDRIASAAAAGFSGIGLYAGQYQDLERAGFAPGGLRDLLDAHGVCLAEIEVVRGWAQGGGDQEREAVVWRMADALGCRYLQAIGPYQGSLDDAGRGFAALCDRAAAHGVLVGLEFLPFTNIATAADALEIVERADRDNGGVCIDVWHHARGAADTGLVRAIPAEKVLAVQMSDGPRAPAVDDYYRDCLENRLPPGEGEFDVVGFIRLLRSMGVQAPWSVEVCNAGTWRARRAAEPVRRLADAMRGVVAAADQAGPP